MHSIHAVPLSQIFITIALHWVYIDTTGSLPGRGSHVLSTYDNKLFVMGGGPKVIDETKFDQYDKLVHVI